MCKKNEATIHLTEIIEGVRTEMHVCEYCANQQGISVKGQIPINELLSNLLNVQPSDEDMDELVEQDITCPHCGFTLEQFRKEPLLGCPYDYEVFDKSLASIIEKAHDGNTVHRGKVPSKASDSEKKQIELLKLRQELDAAVRKEDYETAARLRDTINRLG
jgi:protein arginine kinase activator